MYRQLLVKLCFRNCFIQEVVFQKHFHSIEWLCFRNIFTQVTVYQKHFYTRDITFRSLAFHSRDSVSETFSYARLCFRNIFIWQTGFRNILIRETVFQKHFHTEDWFQKHFHTLDCVSEAFSYDRLCFRSLFIRETVF